MSARGRAVAGLILGVAGGLALAGAAVAEWVAVPADREVGAVTVPDEETVAGAELAPALLPLGLATGVLSLVLALAQGRARRALGAVLVLAALAAAAHGVNGLVGSPAGELGAGPVVLGLGVAVTALAGMLGLRPGSPPTLPARYDLDADDADDEWRIASAGHDDDDDDAPAD